MGRTYIVAFRQYKSKEGPKVNNNEKKPYLTICSNSKEHFMDKKKKKLIHWVDWRESGLKLIKSQDDGLLKEYKMQSL